MKKSPTIVAHWFTSPNSSASGPFRTSRDVRSLVDIAGKSERDAIGSECSESAGMFRTRLALGSDGASCGGAGVIRAYSRLMMSKPNATIAFNVASVIRRSMSFSTSGSSA